MKVMEERQIKLHELDSPLMEVTCARYFNKFLTENENFQQVKAFLSGKQSLLLITLNAK